MPRLTEEELQDMLQRNPKLRVRQMGGAGASQRERNQKLARQIAEQIVPPQEKQNKYRNTKVYIYADGHVSKGEKSPAHGKPEMVFDSVKEYERWGALQVLERAGALRELRRQVPMEIAPKAIAKDGEKLRAIVYKADFMYINMDGETIVEDVKPFDKKTGKYLTTKDFNLKWKLLKAKYTEYLFKLV